MRGDSGIAEFGIEEATKGIDCVGEMEGFNSFGELLANARVFSSTLGNTSSLIGIECIPMND